jgi:hypothetical protein
MTHFGKTFQEYVNKSLGHSNYRIYSEKDHISHFGPNRKASDFSFVFKDSLFIIEAKAGQLPNIGKISHSQSLVADKVQDVILDGFIQGSETAACFEEFGYFETGPKPKNKFLLVVTFHDFYISSGAYFAENVNTKAEEHIKDRFLGNLPIPLENMFVISVRELDLLVSMIERGLDPQEALTSFSKANLDSQNRCFSFSQHLETTKIPTELPSFLLKRIAHIKSRIKELKYESA